MKTTILLLFVALCALTFAAELPYATSGKLLTTGKDTYLNWKVMSEADDRVTISHSMGFAQVLKSSLPAVGQESNGAAVLKLSDGRIFYDWSIPSETGTEVMIVHRSGAAHVSKMLLPGAVLALHPMDKADAASAVAKANAAAAEANRLRRLAEVRERQAVEKMDRLNREQAAAGKNPTPAVEQPNRYEQLKKEVEDAQESLRMIKAAQKKREQEEDEARAAAPVYITHTESALTSSRTVATNVTTSILPPERAVKFYQVKYVVEGHNPNVKVRFGSTGARQTRDQVSAYYGWSETVKGGSGEQLFISAESGNSGGEDFTVKIIVDNEVVKTATSSGGQVIAEVSHSLP